MVINRGFQEKFGLKGGYFHSQKKYEMWADRLISWLIRNQLDELVNFCQRKIEKLERTYKNCSVKFIPYDFRKLADAHAGLHCITKVTERDQVTLL